MSSGSLTLTTMIIIIIKIIIKKLKRFRPSSGAPRLSANNAAWPRHVRFPGQSWRAPEEPVFRRLHYAHQSCARRLAGLCSVYALSPHDRVHRAVVLYSCVYDNNIIIIFVYYYHYDKIVLININFVRDLVFEFFFYYLIFFFFW